MAGRLAVYKMCKFTLTVLSRKKREVPKSSQKILVQVNISQIVSGKSINKLLYKNHLTKAHKLRIML